MKNRGAVNAAIVVLAVLVKVAASGEPVQVVPSSLVGDAQQPQATVDEKGTIYVVFGSQDTIYCSASTDGGKTYREPVVVSHGKALYLGMRRGPRIAATTKAIVVTAIIGKIGGGQDGDLRAWRSTDGGATWKGPSKVSNVTGSAREGLHGMAAGRDGQLCCTWLDLRNRRTEVFASVSDDGGLTWKANRRVYRSPSGSVCECCHPSVAYDADGGLCVMWRNSLEGFRDMYAARSPDSGATFAAAEKLGTGTWQLDHCPMDGGALTVTRKGKRVISVSRRDKEVIGTVSNREVSFGAGEQPWAASVGDQAYVVWVSQRHGDLWLRSPKNQTALKLAEGASDPVVAAPLEGKGPVVVVWESGKHGNATVFALTVDESIAR